MYETQSFLIQFNDAIRSKSHSAYDTRRTNSVIDIRDYFGFLTGKPVTNLEMAGFWGSLSDDEKDYYRNVELTWFPKVGY